MVTRRTAPPLPVRPTLSPDQTRKCISRLKKRIDELCAFEPQKIMKRFANPEVSVLETAIDEVLSAAFGHGTVEYKRYERATRLDHGPIIMGGGNPFAGESFERDESHEARIYLAEGKEEALGLLARAVAFLEEELDDNEVVEVPTSTRSIPNRKVFVVHGHDDAAAEGVARFLEQLDLEAIILKEQADRGRTIIEKFEAFASEVGFAVVLLTPDDLVVGPPSAQGLARARQNVIFELGYFVGKLGRGRACLLRKGDVEIPSDLYGVIYVELDSAGGWKYKLVRELKAAQIDVDANRL